MRFMVAADANGTALYAVSGEKAVKLSGEAPFEGNDLWDVLDRPDAMRAARQKLDAGPAVNIADLTPKLPFNQFGKIICLGLNYVDHVKEGGYEIPEYPAIFIRFPTSMMPTGAPMIKPQCSDRLDYEVELLTVIGRGGKHISEADALDHVFGYSVFNDGSVRDYQRKTHQWTPGKNFDSTGGIGATVVTADELPPGAAGLHIQSRLNGQVMQDANTSDMMWPVAKTIATISEFMTLERGDVIAMGTPPGVGHARKPPVFMFDGDVVEVEIEKIGVCSNPIVNEAISGAEAAE